MEPVSSLASKAGEYLWFYILANVGFCGVLFLKSYFVVIWICGSMINNKVECVFTYTYSYILAIPVPLSQLGLCLLYISCSFSFLFTGILHIFWIMILCELCFTNIVSDWSWSFPFSSGDFTEQKPLLLINVVNFFLYDLCFSHSFKKIIKILFIIIF